MTPITNAILTHNIILSIKYALRNQYIFQEIHPDAFRDLKILVELDLSHNNISQIKPDTFAGNERLQTLTLAHNFIAQMAPYQFPPLKHLVSLNHDTSLFKSYYRVCHGFRLT